MIRIRVCALLMSMVMLAGVFTACNGKKSEQEENSSVSTGTGTTTAESVSNDSGVPAYMNAVGTYPITKEKINVKMMASKDANQPDDWNNLLIFQRLEKTTNIHIDFEIVTGEAFETRMNILMAGNTYPDIIARGLTTTHEETYGPTGKFIDLTGLIDKYAPNLQAVCSKYPDSKAAMTSVDGKIYGLPYYYMSSANVPVCSFFNETWMTNCGITKVPETTGEFYDMLKAFKDKDANGNGDAADEIPFSCQGVGGMRMYLEPAFTGYTGGFSGDAFDVDDSGKVVYVPALSSFKEYLTYCNKLYKEGLIDKDFAVQTSEQLRAKVKSNVVGMYNMSPTIFTGTEVDTNDQKQICLQPLTSPTNSKKVSSMPSHMSTPNAVITDKCKYPEAVMRYLDMFYATEDKAVDGFCGKTLLLGYEGEHWKYTDSSEKQYVFIEPIKTSDDLSKSITITMWLPGFVDAMSMPTSNKFMTQKISESLEKQVPYQRDSYPLIARYTKEESEKSALIENDLRNYEQMMEAKFITGEESLDKFEDYLKELQKYKLDELFVIKQAVYDRWIAASK